MSEWVSEWVIRTATLTLRDSLLLPCADSEPPNHAIQWRGYDEEEFLVLQHRLSLKDDGYLKNLKYDVFFNLILNDDVTSLLSHTSIEKEFIFHTSE